MTVSYIGGDEYSLGFNDTNGWIMLTVKQIRDIQNYDFDAGKEKQVSYEELEDEIFVLTNKLEDCENAED